MTLPTPLVTRSEAVMSGAVVFAGTRVPVQTLLDYIEEGDTLGHFLEDFPTVSREHAVAVLELAKESVFARAGFCLTSAFLRDCATRLLEHEVRTVPEMGWASKQNGALLALASGKFDVFLTTDQRLSSQQAVSKFDLAVVVLVARRNKIEFLLPLVPELRRVLGQVRPGRVYRVGA